MSAVQVLMLDLKSDMPSRPYQLGLLAAYARTEPEVAKNLKFTFFEHPQADAASAIAKEILDADAQLVAISHYAWNHRKLCEVFDLLTASQAKLPFIVLGGPNCAGRFGAETLSRYPIVSAIVEGECEPAFKDICSGLADSPTRAPFAKARNCRFRSASGGIMSLNMGHRMLSLDEVPSPYLTGLLPLGQPPVFYETNRGCPYRCAFCYWGNGNSKIHRMSTDRVREEMTYFAENRVPDLYIADANFGIFESDIEIASLIAEVNAKHGYPFRSLGVNFAKNSSDRVLELAAILRQGRIFCTATLALQSVTPEAEKQSKRFAIAPSKFVDLVRAAHDKNIATYTDLILGMPGETVDGFLSGLEAVICTGIPAIKIHQLSLLPGTEFYDKQEEFGLITMGQAIPTEPGQMRSDYWDFLVYSSRHMTREDFQRGLRLIGANHILHNLNLGKVVNFYLARYGISHSDVYDFFDALILGKVAGFEGSGTRLMTRVRQLILDFASNRLDAHTIEAKLSMEVWFGGKGLRGRSNEPEIKALMREFYRLFCVHRDLRLSADEQTLLQEVVDYNVLISPKPKWVPQPSHAFTYDVDQIWRDILSEIYSRDVPKRDAKASWREFSEQVRLSVAGLLSPQYLSERRGPVEYRVENPMPLLAGRMRVAWVYSNREWFCRPSKIAA